MQRRHLGDHLGAVRNQVPLNQWLVHLDWWDLKVMGSPVEILQIQVGPVVVHHILQVGVASVW